MSKTYKVVYDPIRINTIWNESSIEQRRLILRRAGLKDFKVNKQLVNLNYTELDSDIRFRIECK